MKKSLKISLALAVCLVLVLAAFAACKLYDYARWNLYLINEKLDYIKTNGENMLQYAQRGRFDAERYDFDYSWLEQDEPLLISHALGGIDELAYTNSREAMELAYKNGLRVFEADIQMLDGDILLLHDLAAAGESCGLEEGFGSEEYLASRIHGKYTPMSWQDVLDFMAEHPDVYLVTDTKYNQQPYMSYAISALTTQTAEYDAALLDRLIIQIYSQQMLDVVMDIYPFRSVIYTLYLSEDNNGEVADFCQRSGVGAITMSKHRHSQELVDLLGSMGVHSLIHTINDPQQAALMSESGMSGLYTDFLTPADFAQG